MDRSEHWNQRYATGSTPWDSGLPSKELQLILSESGIGPCRVLEVGCGTGTNAILLAQQGFDVTAVDLAPLAIRQAKTKAKEAGVEIIWVCGDVCALEKPAVPYPLVFDRGCYHCIRRDVDVSKILQTYERVTTTGSRLILLTGNASEGREHGPPGLVEDDLRRELGSLFEINQLRPFRFEDAGGVEGPLGWSCVATRR